MSTFLRYFVFKSLFLPLKDKISLNFIFNCIIKGLSREEIIKATGLFGNGALTKMFLNLDKSGFIRVNDMFGYKKREKIYQLSDYYTLFYFRYIKDNYGKDEHYWSNTNDSPSRKVWEGLS